MAFEMSLPRTKRVKYFNPDGTEVFKEEDSWALVRDVHQSEVAVEAAKGTDKDVPKPESKLPLEALSKLQMARGEVCMMLDLIDMLEARQHMTIENVQPQKTTLAQLTRTSALLVNTRVQQIKDVTRRLKAGTEGLRAFLALQSKFCSSMNELMKTWNVQASSTSGSDGSSHSFTADLRFPGAENSSEAVTEVPIGQSSTGDVEVRDFDGAIVSGVAEVSAMLAKWQDRLIWDGLEQTFQQEAKESTRPNAAQTLATEILQTAQSSDGPHMKELKYLLIKSYLQALETKQSTGEMPKLLPLANAWLRHRWFSDRVKASLHEQKQSLMQTHNESVQIEEIELRGMRSAILLKFKQHVVTLIMQADSLEVRGLGTPLMNGNRSATASVIQPVSKQDIDNILTKVFQSLS